MGKEIRTRFGFYIDLPNNFIAFQDQNLGDLLKEYEGSDINKEFFNDIAAGSTKKDLNVEFYLPKNLDPSINFAAASAVPPGAIKSSIINTLSFSLNESL